MRLKLKRFFLEQLLQGIPVVAVYLAAGHTGAEAWPNFADCFQGTAESWTQIKTQEISICS